MFVSSIIALLPKNPLRVVYTRRDTLPHFATIRQA